MADALNTIEVSGSDDLRKLVDDVVERGAECILVRGGTPVALVTPIQNGETASRGRKRRKPERVLDIIGIGASGGGDVARFKDEYIADAADHRKR